MSIRSETLYVTRDTLRDCRTAATLAGLESPDEWAEMTLRKALGEIADLASLRAGIKSAVSQAIKQWEAKTSTQPHA